MGNHQSFAARQDTGKCLGYAVVCKGHRQLCQEKAMTGACQWPDLIFFLVIYPQAILLVRTIHLISHSTVLCLLVDPLKLRSLVADNIALLEPERNLLLGVLDAVGAVADVAADIDGKVTTDGAGGGGKGVGCAEESWPS